MRHDGRQPIIVPKLQLVDHDRVVFIDDGHDSEAEHPLQRGARMQILFAASQHVARQQYLANDAAPGAEEGGVALHQSTLANRCGNLESREILRPFGEAHGREPRGHCGRCHEHRRVSGRPQRLDVRDDTLHSAWVEAAAGWRQ